MTTNLIINPNDVIRGIEQAVNGVIQDAAEHRATIAVLEVWLEKHGYLIGFGANDTYCIAHYTDGLPLDGKDHWNTFHEMLEDLLARIDAEGGAS